MPEILIVCRTRTPSNHPHLLFLAVTVPNSFPFFPKASPISFLSSVGKGPLPTLVVYAFVIPRIYPMFSGPVPDPVAAVAGKVLDDVTKG